MKKEVKIAVRTLVEYVFSSGSIDTRFQTNTPLIEGTKAHKKVQRTYEVNDQKEVYLKAEIEYGGVCFVIDGRCDGLLFSRNEITIDEIKSTSMSLDGITEDQFPVHWAQAKCYAFMYAKEHELPEMKVRLTYVHVGTDEKKCFERTYSYLELETFMYQTVASYEPFASYIVKHKEDVMNSVKKLTFPFVTYREGQRQLAGSVYKTILEGKQLFAMAPTGIGKTISTTFPSVKAIGEGLISKMFYVTAKTITRQVAQEALKLMETQGTCLNVSTITAKDKICFKEETVCRKEYCEYANGYYDRINAAILDIITEETIFDRKTVERYAVKHKVCPFEFSLDVAYAASDVIIGDYNYIFDPRASLKRHSEEQKKHTVLLIDEAHNLVDRAREMYSASIKKSAFLSLQRMYKDSNPSLVKSSKDINTFLLQLRKRYPEKRELVLKERLEEIEPVLNAFIQEAEQELKQGNGFEKETELLETYFSAQAYTNLLKWYDDHFVTYVVIEKSEVIVKLYCLDPSKIIRKISKAYQASVYFSATFMPLPFYKDVLGGSKDDYTLSISSSFPKENLNVKVLPLSTKYNDRERTKASIAAALFQLCHSRKGNYLFFFPSYKYMDELYEVFTERYPGVKTIVQNVTMTEQLREDYLSLFVSKPSETLVGFAVLGGVFSEGIDLKGDRLIGVAVVGVGLPQIGGERDIIKQYYQSIGKNGFDYAYVYPGMNKVLQAGGRLIRTEVDQGELLLIDERYLQPKYIQLIPPHWRD